MTAWVSVRNVCTNTIYRLPDGRLAVRINGEQDLPHAGEMQQAPNLYFSSADQGMTGVHLRYSVDCGKTWSEEISIIGKNLREELADGKGYFFDAKYGDTSSYSNLYAKQISDSSVLVLYNNAKFDPGDGRFHKATKVRRIDFIDD